MWWSCMVWFGMFHTLVMLSYRIIRAPRTLSLRWRLVHSGLPPNFIIPDKELEFRFSRSSGPGGQNVNKVNTKAEMRLHVMSAHWIPKEVRGRLAAQQANRMNQHGELIVTSQEQRSQEKNRNDCIKKFRQMLNEAFIEPKERSMWEGIGEKGKQIRKREKMHRKSIKESRRQRRDYD